MTREKEIAQKIYAIVGPKDNIETVTHCMTRLRLVLRTKNPAQIEALKKIEGVLGVYDAGEELQIIFGPGRVDRVTEAFLQELEAARSSASPASSSSDGPTVGKVGLSDGAQSVGRFTAAEPTALVESAAQAAAKAEIGDGKALHAKIRAKNATPIKLLFKRIASIFIPLIPAFIACGLISGCLNVVGKYDSALTASPLFQLLAVASSTVFWGMNIIVGRNTAEEFGGTPILGGILANGQNIAFLVALAFAVAASANLPSILYSLYWKRFNTRGVLWSIYGGLISSVGLVIFSPIVSGKGVDATGKNLSLLPTSVDISWFPLENPGIVSIPLGFFLGWLGSVTSTRKEDPRKAAEMEVRSMTGAGAEGAIAH